VTAEVGAVDLDMAVQDRALVLGSHRLAQLVAQHESGMVITLEPGIAYETGDGARKIMLHEEDLVITEAGARLLTRRAASEIPVPDGDWPA